MIFRTTEVGSPTVTLLESADGFETWQYVGSTVVVPWYLLLCPLWWFLNDREPVPPFDYLPTYNIVLRYIAWYTRNPFWNFGRYVMGLNNKTFVVWGPTPALVPHPREGVPPVDKNFGWHFLIYRKWIWLPFISYECSRFIFYWGWQSTGYFGVKFSIHGTFGV